MKQIIVSLFKVFAPVATLILPAAISTYTLAADRSIDLKAGYKQSHALIIWAGKYNYPTWVSLDNAEVEAEQIRQALTRHGFTTRMVSNPTGEDIRDEIKQFIATNGIDPDNRLVIFFSGHGYTRTGPDRVNRGYLVPVSSPDPTTNLSRFLADSISMEEVISWARQIESKHVLFLFDSCFSGTLFKTKAGLTPPETYISSKMNKPVRTFITAGDANQEVPAKSIFVPMLIQALEGKADLNSDGYITGSEIGIFITHNSSRYQDPAFRKPLTPQYGNIRDPDLDRGDIVFVAHNLNFTPVTNRPAFIQGADIGSDTVAATDKVAKTGLNPQLLGRSQSESHLSIMSWQSSSIPGYSIGGFQQSKSGFGLEVNRNLLEGNERFFGIQIISSSPIQLQMGRTYKLRFHVASSNGFDLYARLGEFNYQRSIFIDRAFAIPAGPQVSKFEVDFTANNYISSSSLYFQLGNAPSGTKIQVSNIQIILED